MNYTEILSSDNKIMNKYILRDHRQSVLLFYTIGYILQFITCIFGNVMLLLILPRIKQSDDYITSALFALACSDLFQAFINMPLNYIALNFYDWFLGKYSCKILGYLMFVNRLTGIWLTVYIAFDRYINICHKTRFLSLKTKQFCTLVLLIICIWHFSILFYIFGRLELKYNAKLNCYICYLSLSAVENNLNRILINMTYAYALPVMLLLFFYSSILMTLLKVQYTFKTFLKGLNEDDPWTNQAENYSIIKTLLFYVIFFIFTNFPLFLAGIVLLFFPKLTFTMTFLLVLLPIAIFMQTLNSCLNPWMYYFYSKKFRNEVKYLCYICFLNHKERMIFESPTSIFDARKSSTHLLPYAETSDND